MLPRMKKGALLTDVGSAKAGDLPVGRRTLLRLFGGGKIRFVGGHPMAGSERRGVGSRARGPFPRRRLHPDAHAEHRSGRRGLEIVRELWKAVGCRVRVMAPEAHDRLIAQISHLPHLAAACLVNAASDEALDLAACGFLDTTRVASGEPGAVGRDLPGQPRGAAGRARGARRPVERLRTQALKSGDAKALEALLARAKSRRDGKADQQDTGNADHQDTKDTKNDGGFGTTER